MSDYESRLLKLVVISDLHLLPEGKTKAGLNTTERLLKAFDDVHTYHSDFDLCVFAGDIADKADAEAYRNFENLRSGLDLPQRVMMGNHDNRDIYLDHAVKPMLDENGFVQGIDDIKGHRVIMLDSTIPAEVGIPTRRSLLCEKRLAWLAERLREARDRDLKVILIIHHNPNALQMPVDTYRLEKPDELLAVLKASGADILQILAGHTHVQTAGSWGGYPCATIIGNAHRSGEFLRGRTGQQPTYEGPAQYGLILSDGKNCALHYHNYIEFDPELPSELFPHKMNQPFEQLD